MVATGSKMWDRWHPGISILKKYTTITMHAYFNFQHKHVIFASGRRRIHWRLATHSGWVNVKFGPIEMYVYIKSYTWTGNGLATCFHTIMNLVRSFVKHFN